MYERSYLASSRIIRFQNYFVPFSTILTCYVIFFFHSVFLFSRGIKRASPRLSNPLNKISKSIIEVLFDGLHLASSLNSSCVVSRVKSTSTSRSTRADKGLSGPLHLYAAVCRASLLLQPRKNPEFEWGSNHLPY